MARRRWFALLAVALLAGLAAATYAVAGPDGPRNPPNTKEFKAELNGFNETPSVSSTGWGEFRAKLTDDTTLHYEFTYHGLEGGNSLFAHVHFGSRYFAAGVAFFLCGGSTKPTPCPNVEGHVEGDVTPADVIGPNGQGIEPGSFAEILRAMRAGHSYANIHTQRWPGGEIRGQINDEDQKEFDG
jgi:CHRD domain